MKKIILLMAALFVTARLFAQSPADDYAFKQPTELHLWDEATQNVAAGNTLYRAQRGDVFTLQRTRTVTIGGAPVQGWGVIFWKFTKNRTQLQQVMGFAPGVNPNIVLIDSVYNFKEFFISNDDLKAYATSDFRRPKGIAKLDAFILPFKMRFKNKQPGGVSELTQSINVGPAVSLNRNYGGAFGRNSFAVILALNATNISVDEKTVPGVVSGKTTLLGLSPSIGINWQHDSITFGVFTGVDVLFGDAAAKWAYRNSPWLGISFGTSITDLTTPKKSNPE
jgi:hypothetical protein